MKSSNSHPFMNASILELIKKCTFKPEKFFFRSPKILKPLTSREMEIERLENFLNEHLENEESASIYVSGQPGTGKTASLSYILQQPKVSKFIIHFD